jgi:hypothetical protein
MKRTAYEHRPASAFRAACIAAIVLIGAAPIYAAAADMAAPAASPVKTSASHGDRTEKRITDLHAKLAITPAQEPLWSSVADVMRDNAKKMDELTQARTQNETTMTAVDDLKSYGAVADAHADGIKKFTPAFSALYDSMSDEQKATADSMFRHHHREARKSAATKAK